MLLLIRISAMLQERTESELRVTDECPKYHLLLVWNVQESATTTADQAT